MNLLFLRFNRFLFCLWKREGKRSGRLLKAFYSQAFIFSTSLGTICWLFLFFFLFLSLPLPLQLSFIFSCFEGRCQLFQWNLDPITLDWTVFPLKDFEVWKFHANLRESYLKEPSDCGGDGEGNWYHDLPTRSRKATILGSKFLPETNFLKYIGKRLLLLNRIYFLLEDIKDFVFTWTDPECTKMSLSLKWLSKHYYHPPHLGSFLPMAN